MRHINYLSKNTIWTDNILSKSQRPFNHPHNTKYEKLSFKLLASIVQEIPQTLYVIMSLVVTCQRQEIRADC